MERYPGTISPTTEFILPSRTWCTCEKMKNKRTRKKQRSNSSRQRQRTRYVLSHGTELRRGREHKTMTESQTYRFIRAVKTKKRRRNFFLSLKSNNYIFAKIFCQAERKLNSKILPKLHTTNGGGAKHFQS